ncbi:MAG: DUF1569 domain-containing protein [Bacteroidetes bacterium]|jgi:hypothetical protein|nr:DUF1569 domain-containing protein [Bacteroidota bacterium]
MKTIFDKAAYSELLMRIKQLQKNTSPLWGKMNSAQMLAHCNSTTEVALGDIMIPQSLMGKLIGGLFKKSFLSEKPFSKNGPTAAEFIMAEAKDFEKENERALLLLKRFHEGGEPGATKHPHAFFGKLTSKQWGETQWKHFDHHLRQFGV